MMAAPTNVEITIITITEVPTAPSSSNNKLEFVVPSGRTSSNSVTCKIYTLYIDDYHIYVYRFVQYKLLK